MVPLIGPFVTVGEEHRGFVDIIATPPGSAYWSNAYDYREEIVIPTYGSHILWPF